jgi:hypothetical protein
MPERYVGRVSWAGVWGRGRRGGTKLAQTAKLLFGEAAAAAGKAALSKKNNCGGTCYGVL